MYSSRGSNAYGQQPYGSQSAYGQNVSLFRYLCINQCNYFHFMFQLTVIVTCMFFNSSMYV